MKRSFYTIGSLIILLIAAFVFVLVPIFAGGSGREGRIPPFGSYDGSAIRYEQGSLFANYVAQYADYFKNQNIEINDSNYYYIFNYAFNSTVTTMAQKDFVERSGYRVPKSAVNRQLRPYFQDENGKYSEKLYRLADTTQVASMMKSIEDSLSIARYTDDCYGSSDSIAGDKLYGLKTSKAEIDFIHNIGGKKRSFDLAVFNMDEFPDDQKKAFADKNPSLFVKYSMDAITCDDKTAADTLLKRIKNNEVTFSDSAAASENHTYSDNDGKLKSNYYYQLKQIIKNESDVEKVVELKTDDISDPVETTIGWTIFKCTGEKAILDSSNSDEQKTVYRYIVGNEYGVIEDYFKTQADGFIDAAKAGDFASSCDKFGAKKEEIKAFSLNYGNLSIADKLDTNITGLRNADHNEDFLKTAFTLHAGEVSKAITNGTYILILKMTGEEDKSESLTALAEEKKSSTETEKENNDVAEGEKDPAGKITEIKDEIKSFDSAASQGALFSSPKLVNNLQDVFYKYIANNK